ncbi:hypothetical protein FB567DRAFT_616242 [Paraphoma chrysanthemicola]|uniref:Uncharacterized protein n=1 Tax=Paraphoma chrysanthemicola TaxID=798071 RepID=A0A8K0QR66_9PLEO|nr:hypothetical protein FB567DRAFT_616242 [Paraphoma chrysanthemicola]
MHASKLLFAITVLIASSIAAPAAEPMDNSLGSPVTPRSNLERRGYATVSMYSGDRCDGAVDTFDVSGPLGYRCVRVPSPKRSIRVSGGGCVVKSHSGIDCRGSEAGPAYGTCTGVLYGSISVNCP